MVSQPHLRNHYNSTITSTNNSTARSIHDSADLAIKRGTDDDEEECTTKTKYTTTTYDESTPRSLNCGILDCLQVDTSYYRCETSRDMKGESAREVKRRRRGRVYDEDEVHDDDVRRIYATFPQLRHP